MPVKSMMSRDVFKMKVYPRLVKLKVI